MPRTTSSLSRRHREPDSAALPQIPTLIENEIARPRPWPPWPSIVTLIYFAIMKKKTVLKVISNCYTARPTFQLIWLMICYSQLLVPTSINYYLMLNQTVLLFIYYEYRIYFYFASITYILYYLTSKRL